MQSIRSEHAQLFSVLPMCMAQAHALCWLPASGLHGQVLSLHTGLYDLNGVTHITLIESWMLPSILVITVMCTCSS